MGELTIEPMRRLIKKAGAKRVADPAAEELARVLEERAILLAKEAHKLALHSGRRTVMRRDIKMASQMTRR